MDIDQEHFRMELLPVLKAIAKAKIITFDLEMSGIHIRPTNSSSRADAGKGTLQEQYDEVLLAAETFQVLQFGITCIEEDREKEYYLARPYNFTMSPLTASGVNLRLERNFSFSSSACDFLNKNGFDFGKVFTKGVTYLSRTEEEDIRQEFANYAAKNKTYEDVIISPEDPDIMAFYRQSRKLISTWIKNKTPETDWVNIGETSIPLNGLQRRLVYQLIRNEFPTLRTFPKNDGMFMQIEKLDVENEKTFQKKKAAQFNNQLGKQKGLRWIFEALVGGDLTGVQPEWFQDKSKPQDLAVLKQELDLVVLQIQTKPRHLIVGHNLFMDLAFLYKTFIGPLPKNVQDFQLKVNEFFPMVIDTKYMATKDAGPMGPRHNLKELLAPFRKIHTPLIVLEEKHASYGTSFGKEHEAGFDSWMTAELFVKMTAKLFFDRKDEFKHLPHLSLRSDSLDSAFGGVNLWAPYPGDPDFIGGDENAPLEWHSRELNGTTVVDPSKPSQWIPALNHEFWLAYANKLRVNAADVGVCNLADGR